jgi:hypothetical protein
MMTTIPTIAILNASTVLTDAQVASATPALQTQISRDFAPAWGLEAKLIFVAKGQTVPAGAWVARLLDDSDQAGALGYHDDAGTADAPEARIFVKDDIDAGMSWSVTISHELLEMLADPLCTKTASDGAREYAFEVCDAPEDDAFGYPIDGVLVSDFVLPSWFTAGGRAPFDFRGKITAPFQVLGGGYIGVFDPHNPDAGWTQITNEEKAPGRAPQRFARRARRIVR